MAVHLSIPRPSPASTSETNSKPVPSEQAKMECVVLAFWQNILTLNANAMRNVFTFDAKLYTTCGEDQRTASGIDNIVSACQETFKAFGTLLTPNNLEIAFACNSTENSAMASYTCKNAAGPNRDVHFQDRYTLVQTPNGYLIKELRSLQAIVPPPATTRYENYIW